MTSKLLRLLNPLGLATAFFLLAVWEALVRGSVIAFANVPPPSDVAAAVVSMLTSGELARAVGHTIAVGLAGWFIACALGVFLGAWMGSSATVRRWSGASVEVLRPLPAIAFIPVGVLLFGFSWKTELGVVVYVSVWPVLINTMGAVQNVHRRLLEVAQTMHLSRWQAGCKIIVPACAAYVTVGVRLALALAIIAAILVEMIGVPSGAGYALVREQQSLHPARALAYVAVIALVGLVLNALLVTAARRLNHDAGSGEAAAA